MKANGKMENIMDMEYYINLMEWFMTENLKIIYFIIKVKSTF